jgi:hypothetical protein
VSPTFTDHSRIVPSVTDSPPVGVTMSMISPPVCGSSAVALGCGRCGCGAVGRLDLAQQLADLDRVAFAGEHLDDPAGDRRGNLGVHLVGGDLDQDVVESDFVTFLFVPFQDGALGHRLAHRGHGDLHGGVHCH